MTSLFDMFGADCGHHGDDRTFEALHKGFGLDGPVLETIGRIVHDADLKDLEFGRRDTEGIEKAIRSLGAQLSDASRPAAPVESLPCSPRPLLACPQTPPDPAASHPPDSIRR
jgi:hypothetical protein